MQNSFSTSNYYLNATHQANSMAAQREVASMLLHPYSREQIEQWAKTTGCWVDDVDKTFEQTFIV